jgi:hypothetical protein
MHDTEDKLWWCVHGEQQENEFVDLVAPQVGLYAIINPEKRTNKYAPDLLIDPAGTIADLKAQSTPFFTVEKTYPGYDRNYAVTFNRKDFLRYRENYPEISIIFWIKWTFLTYGRLMVSPIYGVWRCEFSQIEEFVKEGAPLHHYGRRVNDTNGNGRDSYVLDLRRMECLYETIYQREICS